MTWKDPAIRKQKQREYYLKHQEKAKMDARLWHHTHKKQNNERRKKHWYANRETYLEMYKRYRKEHKKELNEYASIYREKNREIINQKIAAYSRTKKGRERNRKRGLNRRRLILGLKGKMNNHTMEQWEELCVRSNQCCCACGKKVKLTRDHIVPLALGGDDSIENIQPLCLPCNARKGKRFIKKYA